MSSDPPTSPEPPRDGDRDALADQIRGFLAYVAAERRMSALTRATYCRALLELRGWAAAQGLPLDARALDQAALRAWLAAQFADRSSATLARKVSTVRSFYRFLTRRGIVRVNPAATLRTPKIPRRLPRFLTVDEAFEVMDAAPGGNDGARSAALARRDAALLELLYGSGLRVAEAAGLTVGDVDLDARRVRVLGKGSKERVVPIGDPSRQALVDYLAVRSGLRPKVGDPPPALFLGRWGTALSTRRMQTIVRRAGRGAGKPDLHPHVLRHTCATHLLDAGADLRGIQELLGHASLATTQRYTHVTVDRLREVYDRAHPLALDEPDPEGGGDDHR